MSAPEPAAGERTYILVIHADSENVVHEVEVTGKSERQIARVERGMLRNMDTRFYTLVERRPEQPSVSRP